MTPKQRILVVTKSHPSHLQSCPTNIRVVHGLRVISGQYRSRSTSRPLPYGSVSLVRMRRL
jgi:hypothetical protein